MSFKTLSSLPVADPLALNDIAHIRQSGLDKQVTVEALANFSLKNAFKYLGIMEELYADVPANPLEGYYRIVDGYYSPGDEGGGVFVWDPDSTLDDNYGMVVKPTSVTGAGRWIRRHEGVINVLWFGCIRWDDTFNNYARLQGAMTYAATNKTPLFAPIGDYFTGNTLVPPTDLEMVGAGKDTNIQTTSGIAVFSIADNSTNINIGKMSLTAGANTAPAVIYAPGIGYGCKFYGLYLNSGSYGLVLGTNGQVENVWFEGAATAGALVDCQSRVCSSISFFHCTFDHTPCGIYVRDNETARDAYTGHVVIEDMLIVNCIRGIHMYQCSSVRVNASNVVGHFTVVNNDNAIVENYLSCHFQLRNIEGDSTVTGDVWLLHHTYYEASRPNVGLNWKEFTSTRPYTPRRIPFYDYDTLCIIPYRNQLYTDYQMWFNDMVLYPGIYPMALHWESFVNPRPTEFTEIGHWDSRDDSVSQYRRFFHIEAANASCSSFETDETITVRVTVYSGRGTTEDPYIEATSQDIEINGSAPSKSLTEVQVTTLYNITNRFTKVTASVKSSVSNSDYGSVQIHIRGIFHN